MKKTYTKVEYLKGLEERLEAQLNLAISDFQNLPDEILNKCPTRNSWSAAQCLWHLNSYGHYYLPEIEKVILKIPISNGNHTLTKSWLGKYFVKLMEPGEKMKKFKAFKKHTPPNKVNGYEITAEFISQLEQLLQLVRLAKNRDINKGKIPISLSRLIKLHLGDVFGFLVAHNERHMQQAIRSIQEKKIVNF